jgi:uncharacterized protein (TIGR03790 family)
MRNEWGSSTVRRTMPSSRRPSLLLVLILSFSSFASRRSLLRSSLWLAVTLCSAVIRHSSFAAPAEWNPARETVVVYNSASASSVSLAKVYALLREIPEDRLIGLPLSVEESITRNEFESSLREPLLRKFAERKWWEIAWRDILDPNGKPHGKTQQTVKQSIRVLVLMRGVPLRVQGSVADNTDPKDVDEASVDSELAALGLVNRQLQGVLENNYYQSTQRFPMHEKALGQLIVGRLDAADDATVRRMMHDTIKAEREGLWGRAVIDFGLMDAGYEEGEQWLGRSVAVFREAGIPVFTDRYNEVLRDDWPLPDTILYFGWYTEKSKGALASSAFRFRPGAIACHLHSFSAATLRDRTSHWCAPLLDHGAAATLGNVWEPYLTLTVHFDIFNARLQEGFTLGEAAWAATPGLSWMNVVVGDPLYRPFAKPRVMLSEEPADLEYALFHNLAVRFLPTDGKKFRQELLRTAEEKQSPRLLELASLVSAMDENYGQASDFLQHAAALYEKPEDKLRCGLYDAELARRSGDTKQSLALVQRLVAESAYLSFPAHGAAMGMKKEMTAK